MAQRRMFSLKIVNTDAFIEMPLSAQALYFHLGMNADDDGFVSNARRVQRLVGAADDDMKILLMKRFILAFDSGVVVIKHWRINNYIKGDRYTPTLYQEEKRQLYVKKNGVYTDHPLLPPPPVEADRLPPSSPSDSVVVPECLQNGTNPEPQVRLGEERQGEVSKGENRINKYLSGGGGDTRARETAESEVEEYLLDRQTQPTAYFGVEAEGLNEVAAFTEAIFARFTTRLPTKNDISNVFLAIRSQNLGDDGVWTVTYPREQKRLLMYAFEQASDAGKAGDWKYINGVLRNLQQRGIDTVVSAEDYDYERRAYK